MELPRIIQGGMGLGISNWRLAKAVALRGQLGVVSGTAIDLILTRRLQAGDPGGHMRRALAAFPGREMAERVIDRYFVEGGKPETKAFAAKPMVGDRQGQALEELMVVANFAEVFLAKEGHQGWVGINFLHKIQTPMLPSLLGAMLAGVSVVLIGAGIPLEIPSILDRLAAWEPVEFSLHVTGAGGDHKMRLDPKRWFPGETPELQRPLFFPIVSSVTLASMLVKKCQGGVNGLVVEDATAGGHNAPPRGALKLSEEGEPMYGPRDEVDRAAIRALGLPFWVAGSQGSPEKLQEARADGAEGIQLGSLFAFCEESGLREDLKQAAIKSALAGEEKVFRDPAASPTGFPFQVLTAPGSLSEAEIYEERQRICDLGYLREAYEREDGSVGWRCPAEQPLDFQKKGGRIEETAGRKCLCNSLMANIGLGQRRAEETEQPLLTCGKDLSGIRKLAAPGSKGYSAGDVLDFLLGDEVLAEEI
ncbi:nitronate monooxygenase [Haloferula luteola]|uniref:Nitronate monooxygenase n=1 Tax=Haloferula luteola TaxID=595692 RepID=A0A840V9W2_9BACT|nr:nitronate monooxygenase [Haloferula luteola]MBB5350740.1 nitronate monooxygenase [Haloferula luteola]